MSTTYPNFSRKYTLTAGLSCLFIMAIFGAIIVLDPSVSDMLDLSVSISEKTAALAHLSKSAGYVGIPLLYLTVVLHFIVAWGVWRIYLPVDRFLSAAAGLLYCTSNIIFSIAFYQLQKIFTFYPEDSRNTTDIFALVGQFHQLDSICFTLSGVYYICLALLVLASRQRGRTIMSIGLSINGAGFIIGGLDYPFTDYHTLQFQIYTSIGGFVFWLWLLIIGIFGSNKFVLKN